MAESKSETICGFPRKNVEALAKDLSAIAKETRAARTGEELTHLKKIERWGRACSALGYGTAWIAPNPISPALIALGKNTRWAIVAHHINHGGFDKVSNVPDRYTSAVFAQGWRRYIDWFDWISPEGWNVEHNQLHHYRLGEVAAPDLVEENMYWLEEMKLSRPLRYLSSFIIATTWKWSYYAPTTLMEARAVRAKKAGQEPDPRSILRKDVWDPRGERGAELWKTCLGPYAAWHFVAIPAMFSPLGTWATASVAANSMMGEILANAHAFAIIGTNHCGEDLYRFDTQSKGRAEFYLRQILGSTNYRPGGDLNDWLHGWLNYQIEHHLWPDMTPLEYRKLQPKVKAACEKYGIPYVQEGVWKRVRKTLNIMTGKTEMLRTARTTAVPPSAPDLASAPAA